MKLIHKHLNFELYHSEDNKFFLQSNYIRRTKINYAIKVQYDYKAKQIIIEDSDYSKKIPAYIIRRIEVFIHNYLRPFRVYDSVLYKDKEYTIIDVDGVCKINGEWKEVISYIPKFGKIKCHREKQEFISKFKKI